MEDRLRQTLRLAAVSLVLAWLAGPAPAAAQTCSSTITVRTPSDAAGACPGAGCSLRTAIANANASPDCTRIEFDFTPATGGSIVLVSPLPTITSPVEIDGLSHPDASGLPEGGVGYPEFRVGIRGGGCTGFSYVFEWADAPKPTDKVITAHGVTVVVDPKSFVYLAGMQLDFVRGMMGHGFKFNNPNAKGSCGCGESVQF